MIGFKALWLLLAKRWESLLPGLLWPNRLRETNASGAVTTEYLSLNLNDNSSVIRQTAAGILVLFLIIYISAQIDATGKAFSSSCWIPSGVDNGYWLGAVTGFLIVAIYTGAGGLQAVAWSDLFRVA